MTPRFLKNYRILVFSTLFLVALGGSVRAMNAGLACPDWPLCFGDVIPDFHPQVYFEFIHRVIAGLIAIALVLLNIKVMRSPNVSKTVKWACLFSWVLVLIQIILGGLTVLMQLHDKVVAAHLGLGTAFFATLVWIYSRLQLDQAHLVETRIPTGPTFLSEISRYRGAALFVTLAIYGQIILGGLVASNYAANVCPEFPLCHGELIPTLSGVIGLQVIHRLGAYALFVIISVFTFYVIKTARDQRVRRKALLTFGILTLQIMVGIANVLFQAPPLITVLHLAIGASLLGVMIRFYAQAQVARQLFGVDLPGGLSQLKTLKT